MTEKDTNTNLAPVEQTDKPPKFRPATEDEPGDFCILPDRGKFADLFGVQEDDVANARLNSLFTACGIKQDSPPDDVLAFLNDASEILHSVKPKDALEGLLVGQMIATHRAAFECFRRAAVTDNADNHMRKINLATKLTRTFTAQMEALAKYRNKGKQRITVEHVEVKDGGQAVIGNIDGTGGRGRK